MIQHGLVFMQNQVIIQDILRCLIYMFQISKIQIILVQLSETPLSFEIEAVENPNSFKKLLKSHLLMRQNIA